jgi:hypothetical protein
MTYSLWSSSFSNSVCRTQALCFILRIALIWSISKINSPDPKDVSLLETSLQIAFWLMINTYQEHSQNCWDCYRTGAEHSQTLWAPFDDLIFIIPNSVVVSHHHHTGWYHIPSFDNLLNLRKGFSMKLTCNFYQISKSISEYGISSLYQFFHYCQSLNPFYTTKYTPKNVLNLPLLPPFAQQYRSTWSLFSICIYHKYICYSGQLFN